MRQILLFDTAIATTNLGDEIILESVKQGLAPILYEALTFRLGTHIENYSAKQLGNDNWKYQALCERADFKFVCGTNLLADSLKGRFPQWMLNKNNTKLYKDAVLVGVGKISDYKKVDLYTRYLYKRCLSRTYKHSVRDEAAKAVLNGLGFKAINTGCPTLWKLTPEFCAEIPVKKANKAIISVSGYRNQIDRKADIKMINCVLRNYQKVYGWIQTVEDKAYFDTLIDMNRIEYFYSLEKYENILKQGDVDYIGTRLHGGVYALLHKCRAIVIAIDQRAMGFHESNNLPIVARDDIENLLDKKINSSWETKIRLDEGAIQEFMNQFQ